MLTKIAFATPVSQPTPMGTGRTNAWDVGGYGLDFSTEAYGLNAANNLNKTTGAAKGFGSAVKTYGSQVGRAGKILSGAGLAFSGGMAINAANDFRKGYNSSNFAGTGFAPVQQAKYALGTTEGRNRMANIATNGGMTLAGAGIGAAIGAIPGAMIGGTIGGVAELGVGAFRTATGWNGDKYDQAKSLIQGGGGAENMAQTMQNTLSNTHATPEFTQDKWFGMGKRDLFQDAYNDSLKR